ncbi:MAG TPA: outer membrane protein transport protein [Candidatus Ozemobacteraceae bacterium]|nr:outer membrane protein transport protein [Candidatus Ozemobacteraceae bacterium]
MSRFIRWAIVLWCCLPAVCSYGGGFMVREHSQAALGSAFAGVHAGAHDLADMFFNPAALYYQPERAALAGMASMLPKAKFRLSSATTFNGTVVTGNPGGENIGEDALIPSLYLAQPSWKGWRLGLSVNAPWGLATKCDPNWVGRYYAIESRLTSMNVMPTVARRLSPRWVAGIGFQMQKLDAKLSNAVDYGTIAQANGVPGAAPTQQDGLVELTGEDWGYGLVLGFMYEASARTRFGFSYRSKVDQNLKGTAEFSPDAFGVKNGLSALSGAFVTTGAQAAVTTPEVVGFGVKHEMTASMTLVFDAVWNRWSRYKGLTVHFDNPAQAASRVQEDWRDVWLTSIGLLYKVAPKWTLRAGYAVDRSPIPNEHRIPRIPGSDGRFTSVGARYQASERCHIDVGYMSISYDGAPITLKSTDPDSTFRGNLSGRFSNSFRILGAQIAWNW